MKINPMLPKISPELRMAIGNVKTPIPMFPFKMWTMVSRFEMDKASSRSFNSGWFSMTASSSSTASMSAIGGGAAHIEMVRRLKRSTSFRISVVDIVLLRYLVPVPIRGLIGRPEPDEFVESTLPYVLNILFKCT